MEFFYAKDVLGGFLCTGCSEDNHPGILFQDLQPPLKVCDCVKKGLLAVETQEAAEHRGAHFGDKFFLRVVLASEVGDHTGLAVEAARVAGRVDEFVEGRRVVLLSQIILADEWNSYRILGRRVERPVTPAGLEPECHFTGKVAVDDILGGGDRLGLSHGLLFEFTLNALAVVNVKHPVITEDETPVRALVGSILLVGVRLDIGRTGGRSGRFGTLFKEGYHAAFGPLLEFATKIDNLVEGKPLAGTAQKELVQETVWLAGRVGDSQAVHSMPGALPGNDTILHLLKDALCDDFVDVHNK